MGFQTKLHIEYTIHAPNFFLKVGIKEGCDTVLTTIFIWSIIGLVGVIDNAFLQICAWGLSKIEKMLFLQVQNTKQPNLDRANFYLL